MKFRKLIETLKGDILSGKYSSTAPIPSLRALMNRYGLSTSTVRSAFAELEREGLISRTRGRGTFVTKSAVSRKIGLVVPGIAYSEFYPPLVSDISNLCQRNDYALLFGDIAVRRPEEWAKKALQVARNFVEQGVSGVIYQPVEFLGRSEEINVQVTSAFDAAGLPVVLLAYDIRKSPWRSAYDIVGINNVEAGAVLGEHLKGLGARDVHFLLRPRWSPSGQARLRGVASAFCEDRGDWMRRNVLHAVPDDLSAVRAHLRSYPKTDAFVCGCDEDAMLLSQTLARLKKRVPEEIMLAGFDDVRYASLMAPPLTTIRQPHDQIAEVAFRCLVERMGGSTLPPREIFLPAPLVERGSTMMRKPLKSVRAHR